MDLFFAGFIIHEKFRLEDADIPTSLEILVVIRTLLEHTQIPAANFINDTMVTTLRLININIYAKHGEYIFA